MLKNLVRKKTTSILATYALIFTVVLVFNFLSPLAADDFCYSFSWADNSRIKSIRQIIDSMAVHHNTINGRLIIHAVAQFVLIFPKWIFNVLNSLVTVFLLHLITKYARPSNSRSAVFTVTCGAVMIFNFTPKFSDIFLWLMGSINYSWSICCLLVFLWPYAKAYLYGEAVGKAWCYLHIPFAFVAGSCTEAFSPAAIMIAFCISVLLLIKDRHVPWQFICSLAAAVFGFLFLLSSPASSGRVSIFSLSTLANNIIGIISSVREHLLALYIIYAIFLALSIVFKTDLKRIILSLLLVIGGAASLATYSLAVYFVDRHMAFSVILTVVAVLILMVDLFENGKRIIPVISFAYFFVLFVFNFTMGSMDIVSGFYHALEREAAIESALQSGAKEILLDPYVPFTDYAVGFFLDQGADYFSNVGVGRYYGFDSVYGTWC